MKCLAALCLICQLSQVLGQTAAENVAFTLRYPSGDERGDNVNFIRATPRLGKGFLSHYQTYELSGKPWVEGQVFQFFPLHSTLPQTWYYIFGKDDEGKLVICYPPVNVLNLQAESSSKVVSVPAAYRGFRLSGKGTHKLCIIISSTPIEDWESLVATFTQPSRNFQRQVRKTLGARLESPARTHYEAETLAVEYKSKESLVPVFLTIYCTKATR
ncbi:MAG: hypothetical protein IPN76_26235 [Saprospiraceae bacterium]|nr:hypothetical protein [Saprospiraceae bacterium]